MQSLMRLLLAPAAVMALTVENRGSSGDSPIGKVVSMLEDLESKMKEEGLAAEKVMKESRDFCKSRTQELGFEIKSGTDEVEDLKAAIQEEAAVVTSESEKVEQLVASIATAESNLKNATEIKANETKDFLAEEKELMETIDMISRASSIIQKEMSKGSASLLQQGRASSLVQALKTLVEGALLPSADASRLASFAQQQRESASAAVEMEMEQAEEALGAPAPAIYTSKSGGILEALEDLQEKAETQLEDARSKEVEAKHNFKMLEQSLTDEIKFANKELADAKSEIAEASEKKASAEGDLEVESKELASDTAAKEELDKDCEAKEEDFAAESKSRAEELEAIKKAQQIISEVAAPAFLQLSRSKKVAAAAAAVAADVEALRIVRNLAMQGRSQEVSLLASRMTSLLRHSSSRAAGFDKVKTLIEELIAKLEKEASEEATKKAYCDKELIEATAKKELRGDQVTKLSTKIEQTTAQEAKLKEEVALLQKDLGALLKSQAEMDKLRAEESGLFTSTKADLEKGLDALRLAIKTLKEYYGKDSSEYSHENKEGGASGVIALLEVCESDFAKNLAEITTTEEAAVAAYEEQSQKNSIEKTVKEGDIKYKTKEATALGKTASELKADHSGLSEELDAVVEYLQQLTAECTIVPETYEETQKRRASEIAGLKEALAALSSGSEAEAPSSSSSSSSSSSLVQRFSLRRSLRIRKA